MLQCWYISSLLVFDMDIFLIFFFFIFRCIEIAQESLSNTDNNHNNQTKPAKTVALKPLCDNFEMIMFDVRYAIDVLLCHGIY